MFDPLSALILDVLKKTLAVDMLALGFAKY